ncbi:MAG: thymidylate kinase [Chloroflexi bacterium]|jgi:dTMP kinase|nr:MAG: thymidylate kinase [Chloroflexota bacterium]
MTQVRFYGSPLPNFAETELPGKFIVIEGTDGVGRSTQIALLQEWLESLGFAAAATGLRRSSLAGKGIDRAKQGHTVSDTVMYLLYATDLADRLESQIIPALRAGMVVLTDRYIYSMIVRAQARGTDPQWIRKVVGFALVPDATFYLQADLPHLVPRVLSTRGFDYWESGMDFLKGRKLFRNYVRYQTRLLTQFDAVADEFGFRRIDANCSVVEVFNDLRREVAAVVTPMKRNGEEE